MMSASNAKDGKTATAGVAKDGKNTMSPAQPSPQAVKELDKSDFSHNIDEIERQFKELQEENLAANAGSATVQKEGQPNTKQQE